MLGRRRRRSSIATESHSRQGKLSSRRRPQIVKDALLDGGEGSQLKLPRKTLQDQWMPLPYKARRKLYQSIPMTILYKARRLNSFLTTWNRPIVTQTLLPLVTSTALNLPALNRPALNCPALNRPALRPDLMTCDHHPRNKRFKAKLEVQVPH
jgi:hypothetical protein